MSGPTVSESVLGSLAQLQLEALRTPIPRLVPGSIDGPEAFEHVDLLSDLARNHGFEPLGVGSSRFVVVVDPGVIAKLAWTVQGLANSLSEAAAWLASPRRVRRYLPECFEVSEQLVLLVEHTELISPTQTASTDIVDPDWIEETNRAGREWIGRINALHVALGEPPRKPGELRMDNYGRNRRGELVALDFAGIPCPGTQEAMGWIWRKLRRGAIRLEGATPQFRDKLARTPAFQRAPAVGGTVSRGRLLDAGVSPQELTAKAGWVGTWDEIEDHEREARGGSLSPALWNPDAIPHDPSMLEHEAAEIPEGTDLYLHGGPAGLEPGSRILPSSKIKTPSHRDLDPDEPTRADRVYVTSKMLTALTHCQRFERGVVYEVAPEGELEPDPELVLLGGAWMVPSAVVVRVVRGGFTAEELGFLRTLNDEVADRLRAKGLPDDPNADSVQVDETHIEVLTDARARATPELVPLIDGCLEEYRAYLVEYTVQSAAVPSQSPPAAKGRAA